MQPELPSSDKSLHGYSENGRAGLPSFESNTADLNLTSSSQAQQAQDNDSGNRNDCQDPEGANRQAFIINSEQSPRVLQELRTLERGCSSRKRPHDEEVDIEGHLHQRARLDNCANNQYSMHYPVSSGEFPRCPRLPEAATEHIEYCDNKTSQCLKVNEDRGSEGRGTAFCCSVDHEKLEIERAKQERRHESNVSRNLGEQSSSYRPPCFERTCPKALCEDSMNERASPDQNVDLTPRRGFEPICDCKPHSSHTELAMIPSNCQQLSTTASPDRENRESSICTRDPPSLGADSTTAAVGERDWVGDRNTMKTSSSCTLGESSTTSSAYDSSRRYARSVSSLCVEDIQVIANHRYEDDDPYTETVTSPCQGQSSIMASINREHEDIKNEAPSSLPGLVSSSSGEGDVLYDVELNISGPSHSSEEEWVAISNQIREENMEIERYYAYPEPWWEDLLRTLQTIFQRLEPGRVVDAFPLRRQTAPETAGQGGYEGEGLRKAETEDGEDEWLEVADGGHR